MEWMDAVETKAKSKGGTAEVETGCGLFQSLPGPCLNGRGYPGKPSSARW
jgi:hypothetical protein